MTKAKDKLTREKAIVEIHITEDLIEEAILEVSSIIRNFPDTWIDSVNKNYSSFLCYLQGITKKYNEEIKPKKK